LKIEWLVTLVGYITWIFTKLTIDFNVQGRRHALCGSSSTKVKTTKMQQLVKALEEGVHVSIIKLCMEEGELPQSITTHVAPSLASGAITQLFLQEPIQLPPFMPGFDHKIPLLQGIDPVNKRSYRYCKRPEGCDR